MSQALSMTLGLAVTCRPRLGGEEVGQVISTQSLGTTALTSVPVSLFSPGQFKVSRTSLCSSPTNFTSP